MRTPPARADGRTGRGAAPAPRRPGRSVVDRTGFALSAGGCTGASILLPGSEAVLEVWQLGRTVTRRTVPWVRVERGTSVLPLDDGTLVLCQPSVGDPECHTITALPTRHEAGRITPLGHIRGLSCYLLPAPPGWAAVALAVVIDRTLHSTVWRLNRAGGGMELLVRLPGALSGGIRIDEDSGLLAVNQVLHGRHTGGLLVDLVRGSWRRIWSLSAATTDRIHCYAPRTRRLVVSSDVSGEPRLGWGVLGERTVHFPPKLHRDGYRRHALTFDEAGERVLVHETEGTLSRLYVYHLAEDDLSPLPLPDGTITSPACWTGDTIRLPYSCPGRPPTIGTLRLTRAEPAWSVPRETGYSGGHSVHADRTEVTGAAGRIEAIVYGGPQWQSAKRLVVALHGGPLAAWRFQFDPLFHQLAGAGIAVLAPNYRGSTGYGTRHRNAVLGHWGGPDLDDVLAIGRELAEARSARGRPAPVVLGASYGAYLALLAAGTEPSMWSACVALAPFLSPGDLSESAAAPVRERLDELGARRGEDQDVLEVCASLRMPVLLAHGVHDERIPVQQSRRLERRLAELGPAAGPLDYLELNTDHAGVVEHHLPPLVRRITDFCRTHASGVVPGSGRRARTSARSGERR
ncbi:alpha/beta hydrolase family protein [Amycolatopsis jejuensis]|uniref:alpha/beta hydrolase family protein n=1 Tax=Amycolatopsis jejuensis TaxID=330084 RepID=UPI00068DB020|nr:alpha/beta fold hydrolase [Amycolatopsis jejuensis]